VGLREELEARFGRKLPEDRDVLVMDAENDVLVALPRSFTIATLFTYFRTEFPVMLDLKHERVFAVEEVTPAEFLMRLEVTPKDTN